MRNKNYGKLDKGRLVLAPNPMRTSDGWQIGNPKAEQYLAEGYKHIIYAEMPSKDDFYFTPVYTESATDIVQSWEEHCIEESDL